MVENVKQRRLWLGVVALLLASAVPATATSLIFVQQAGERLPTHNLVAPDRSSLRLGDRRTPDMGAPLVLPHDHDRRHRPSRRLFVPGLYYYEPDYDNEPDIPGPVASSDNQAPPAPDEKPAESKTVRIPSGARFMRIPGSVSAPDTSDDQSQKTSHAEAKSPRHHLLAKQARSTDVSKGAARKHAASGTRDAAQ